MSKIKDLIYQERNANKGTQYGDSLLEKSLNKFGFIEAGVLDKNGGIVSGNHRIAKAGEIGFDDVIIVKGDRTKAIMVQYDDIDLETDEGKELALALNQTAKTNIDFDFDVLESELSEDTLEEWGIENLETDFTDYSDKNKEIDIDELDTEMIIKLKYSEEDYNLVKEALSKIAQTPEQAVWKLLKL